MEEVKKQKRQFLVILLLVFFSFLGISMPYLIFPALFLNPEYSILSVNWDGWSPALLLGITLAAYPLGQFVGSPILGALSDDYGRKQVLAGSLLFAAFCNLLTALAIQWGYLILLVISRFATGLMEGNVSIARAMGADLKMISKHKTFGKINAAASIAFILGPLIGALMTDKGLLGILTAATPFYVVTVLFLGLTLVSSLVLNNITVPSPLEIKTFWQRINIIKRMAKLFANKRLQFLILVSTLITLSVDIFYEFGPVYLTAAWKLEPAQLIIYNGVLCLGLAVGNGWLPAFFSSRISNRLAVISSVGGMALFFMGMVFVTTPFWMLILFILSGLVIGLSVTVMTVKISDAASDSIQGEVMGVQLSLRVLGDSIICLLGGALSLVSFKLILLVASAISFFAMLYYIKKT